MTTIYDESGVPVGFVKAHSIKCARTNALQAPAGGAAISGKRPEYIQGITGTMGAYVEGNVGRAFSRHDIRMLLQYISKLEATSAPSSNVMGEALERARSCIVEQIPDEYAEEESEVVRLIDNALNSEEARILNIDDLVGDLERKCMELQDCGCQSRRKAMKEILASAFAQADVEPATIVPTHV